MHISTEYLANGKGYKFDGITIVSKYEVAYELLIIFRINLSSFKVKVKVKIMHILTTNFCQIVTTTQKLLLISNSKSHVRSRLAYLDVTLDHSTGQLVKVVHISMANISDMVAYKANSTISIKYDVTCWLASAYLDLTLAYSN